MVRDIVWPNSVNGRTRVADFLRQHQCAAAVQRIAVEQLRYRERTYAETTYFDGFDPIDAGELMDVVAASVGLRELNLAALGKYQLRHVRVWMSVVQLPDIWPSLRKLAIMLVEDDDQRDAQWSMVRRCANTLQHLVCSINRNDPAIPSIALPALRQLTIFGSIRDQLPRFVSQLISNSGCPALQLDVGMQASQLCKIDALAATKVVELKSWKDPQLGIGWLWSTDSFVMFTNLRRLKRWALWEAKPADFWLLPRSLEDVEIVCRSAESVEDLIEQLHPSSTLPALRSLHARLGSTYLDLRQRDAILNTARTTDIAERLRQACVTRSIDFSWQLEGYGLQ